MKRLAFLGVLALTSPALAADAETKLISTERGWSLMIDPSLDYGCFVIKTSPGVTFRLQHDPTREKVIAFIGSQRWKSLDEGKFYPISFQIDGNEPWQVEALAQYFDTFPSLRFGVGQAAFLREFSAGRTMSFSTNGRSMGIVNLDGSGHALDMLAECMREVEKYKDPFADSPPSPPPPVYVPKAPPLPAQDDPFDT